MSKQKKKAKKPMPSDAAKEKERIDRKLLSWEIGVGFCALLLYIALLAIICLATMSGLARVGLLLGSTAFLFLVLCILVKIEQVAGYYECGKCGHRHVPTYAVTLFAMHFGRTRYMRCPKCDELSWQKKRLKK